MLWQVDLCVSYIVKDAEPVNSYPWVVRKQGKTEFIMVKKVER